MKKNLLANTFPLIKKTLSANDDLLELGGAIIPVVRTINAVRIAALSMVTVILLLRLKLNLLILESSILFFIFFAYILCGVLFFFINPEKMPETQRAVWRVLQLFVDLLFITLLIYFSGNIHSRLAFLYIIPVISAASISLGVLSVITGASLALYYGLIYIIGKYALKLPDASYLSVDYFSDIQLLRHGITILIVAFAGGLYIQTIRKQSKAILKLKDEFLFVVLHDVRSPVTAIRWIIEKYKKPDFAERYPEIQEDILSIEQLTRRIYTVSESLLLLAKNQHIPIATEPLNAIPIIKSALKEMEPGIAEKHIIVEYQPPSDIPHISANTDFLKEALINLLSNAIKYNKNGGRIAVYHHIENGRMRISLLNTGPKIEPKDAKNLFYPYERGNMEHKMPGTGLGLYITRKIIEKMDGAIGIESSSDKETVFYILLPLARTSLQQ
jgi:signal transduction histidine kinase